MEVNPEEGGRREEGKEEYACSKDLKEERRHGGILRGVGREYIH